MRAVRDEYEAARQGITFVNRNWQKHNVYEEVNNVTPKDFHRVADRLFATYVIRLSAEFEGTLKHHLASNHPEIKLPKDAKVDWLISKVTKSVGFTVDTKLRDNMEKVRTYRNEFAHSGLLPAATFTFDQALSWFNTFLAQLPEPNR